jgi:hypothetical protein
MMRRFWEKHFLGYELIVATIISALVAAWGTFCGGTETLGGFLAGRQTVYATLAAMAATLLGFLIATITILQGVVASDGFQRLRESNQYPTLWRTFVLAMRGLALGTAAFLIGMILDRDDQPLWPLTYLCIWLVLVDGVLVARSVWILERLLTISSTD